jgi:hypothetical protein
MEDSDIRLQVKAGYRLLTVDTCSIRNNLTVGVSLSIDTTTGPCVTVTSSFMLSATKAWNDHLDRISENFDSGSISYEYYSM